MTDPFETAARGVFAGLGIDATYTPVSGSPASLKVIKDKETLFSGDGLPTAERQTVISLLQADWPANPAYGDVISIGGTGYTVIGLAAEDGDDGIEWRVRVRLA